VLVGVVGAQVYGEAERPHHAARRAVRPDPDRQVVTTGRGLHELDGAGHECHAGIVVVVNVDPVAGPEAVPLEADHGVTLPAGVCIATGVPSALHAAHAQPGGLTGFSDAVAIGKYR
jgi:hypothetical protein